VPVIIAPEPALVISRNSVTSWILRLVKSVGLFKISETVLAAADQSGFTLTCAPAAILSNLSLSTVVKSFADKPLPASVFCFKFKASDKPVILYNLQLPADYLNQRYHLLKACLLNQLNLLILYLEPQIKEHLQLLK
jgi:hypothetical protein